MNLNEQRILVTGGSGFLGSHVCEELQTRGLSPGLGVGTYQASCSAGFDLTDPEDCEFLFRKVQPHLVIHCAAFCGGIGANQKSPARMYRNNVLMNANVFDAAVKCHTQKIVALGSVCAYPKDTPAPFKEEDIWNGYPEETNAAYGVAKRAMLTQCHAYRQEFGLNAVYLIPTNLYGPRDCFRVDTSHVIPALIRKIFEARDSGAKSIEIWGTGKATREFLYVEDAAKAIVDAAEEYDDAAPLNLGGGEEITIEDLASQLAAIIGYQGFLNRDISKPDGQPRRFLDCSRARSAIRFDPKVKLSDGLPKTVEWYAKECGYVWPKPEPQPEPSPEPPPEPKVVHVSEEIDLEEVEL